MVVYRLVISNSSLDVVGFYDSESTSRTYPDGMRDGILYKIVVDDEVLIALVEVYQAWIFLVERLCQAFDAISPGAYP